MRVILVLAMMTLFAGATSNAATRGSALYDAAQEGDLTQVLRRLRAGDPVGYKSRKLWRTPLHTAAFNGHAEVVAALLAAGADPDARDKDGWTALLLAAHKGHAGAVESMIAGGANPEVTTRSGSYALDLALSEGLWDVAKVLASSSATLNNRKSNGWTRLASAVSRSEHDRLALLLELGADTESANRDGRKPLYIAAQEDDLMAARTLIAAGADVNGAVKDQRTPLHAAARYGHLEMASLLVAAGADPSLTNRYGQTPLNVAARQNQPAVADWLEANAGGERHQDGWTPLHDAARDGDVNAIQSLLASGAAVDAGNKDRMTPLHIAARNNHVSAVETLLEAGAGLETRNVNERTALYLAAHEGSKATVERLITAGAEVDARDSGQFTPLHAAILGEVPETAQVLVTAGADVNARSHKGDDATSLAAATGDAQLIALFAAHESSLETPDDRGDTALYTAIQRNNLDAARQLLGAGADPKTRNEWGWTLWHVATTAEAGALLLPYELDVNAEDNYGWTPLMNAAFNRQSELALLLIEHRAKPNQADATHGTALHMAVTHGLEPVVAALLATGADMTIENGEGATPTDLANASGSPSMTALFER